MNGCRATLAAGLASGMVAAGAIASAAQEEGTESVSATWVTGVVQYASACDLPTVTELEGVTQERGYRCGPQVWTSDDDRLGGEAVLEWNADLYRTENGSHALVSAAWDIRGETGGWHCINSRGLTRDSGPFAIDVQGTERLHCTGDGANEGLSAVLTATWSSIPRTFEGLIIDGSLPPAP